MAAPSSPSTHVRIFISAYMRGLLQSPVRLLQTSVAIELNIPERDTPEQPLGRAMKTFYDAAIFERGEARTEREIKELFPPLNAELQRHIPARVRGAYRLSDFTYAEYARVMQLRQQARARGHEMDELNPKHSSFWGSNRQLMFGQVVTDIFAANLPSSRPLPLLSAIFCSPTGGIIGAGTHSKWAELIGHGVLRYSYRVLSWHSICHDASGYCKNALDIGVGYTYIDSRAHILWVFTLQWAWGGHGFNAEKGYLAGQLDGCKYWKSVFRE
jgi:hypothetical protein